MLLYYPFWMFMGFILHIYIIFGTNLLTGGPAHIAVFLPILVFRRKGISNGVQTEWNLRERDFLTEHDPGDLDPTSRNKGGGHEVGGRAQGASTLVTSSEVSWSRVQVSWITFGEKITFPKVLFRLDFVWYSVSPKHRNRQKNSNSGPGLRLIG